MAEITVSRFARVLQKAINTQKIDFSNLDKWLIDYLRGKSLGPLEIELTRDVIRRHLKNNKCPDGKTLQLKILDQGLISQDLARQLMKKLWTKLLDDQKVSSERHLKTISSSSQSSSSSRARAAATREADISHYLNNTYTKDTGHREYNDQPSDLGSLLITSSEYYSSLEIQQGRDSTYYHNQSCYYRYEPNNYGRS